MQLTDLLADAHRAHDRRDYGGARRALRDAAALAQDEGLSGSDLALLSDACWWVGDIDGAVDAGGLAHHRLLADGDPEAAARVALDVGIIQAMRGQETAGSGWIARAVRLLDDLPETRTHGYAAYVTEVLAGPADVGPEVVIDAARRIQSSGRRFDDPGLVAVGQAAEGRALVQAGAVSRGMALLDEALLAVQQGGLAPDLAGNICCTAITACHEVADLARMTSLVAVADHWLAGMPDAVVYTGVCRVHRCQVRQISGEWDRAAAEAAEVCTDLAGIDVVTVAEATYQLGELHRMRGDTAAADVAYRSARELGWDPQPGAALLQLARGRPDAACASISAALAAVGDHALRRAPLCTALVDIAVAAGHLHLAREAADELCVTAGRYGTAGLAAAAAQAAGTVLLADGHAARALPELRDAARRWHELRAPFHCARTAELLGRTYQALGDAESATAELEAAVAGFRHLGAAGEVARVMQSGATSANPDRLTDREVQVLALVAAGRSNREVATVLGISPKTVARHLSNIFTKAGVRSRTEAAGYAFARGLVVPEAAARPDLPWVM